MRIEYYPDTDSLVVRLKVEARGLGHSEDVTLDGNVTAHYSADDELLSLEIQGQASELFDAEDIRLSVIDQDGVHPRCWQRSKVDQINALELTTSGLFLAV